MCQHRNQEKSKFDYGDIRRIMLLGIWAMILIPFGFYISFFLLYRVNINSLINNQYPASIPDIYNEFECEKSGRTWRNDKCWDYKHNPLF